MNFGPTSSLRQGLNKLENYYLGPLHPIYAAVFRIGLGAVAFSYYAQVAPVFHDIFGADALGRRAIPDALLTPAFYSGLLTIALLCSITTTLGLFSRTSVAGLFLCHTLVTYSNMRAFWGCGPMLRHFLIFLFFSNPGGYFSLDRRLNGAGPLEAISAWPIRLAQLQVCLIYFSSVLGRVFNLDWFNGFAVPLALTDGVFSRWQTVDWLRLWPALAPLSYVGLVLESLGAFLVFFGPWRIVLVFFLMSMHAMLEIAAVVQYWQPLMIVALTLYLPLDRLVTTPVGSEAWPARENSRSRGAAAALAIVSLLLAISAVPMRILPRPWINVQSSITQPLLMATLVENVRMTMFDSFNHQGRWCFAAFRDNHGRSPIYASPSDYCFSSKPRWVGDELHTTIFRMLVSQDELERRRVARFLCRRAGRGPRDGPIFTTILVERLFQLDRRYVKAWTLVDPSSVDCLTFDRSDWAAESAALAIRGLYPVIGGFGFGPEPR